jgi:DNA-binding Lrp family transcriptional regulator
MPTVIEVADSFGVTRDRLHYLIKVAVKEGKLQPQKEGKRFILTDQDVLALQRVVKEKTKPWAAIMTLKVPGLQTEHAVDVLKDQFREVVWVAGAWGDMSVIALLESGKFENIASVPFKVRERMPYVNDTRTYIIPSEHYHVKDLQRRADERLAVILINLIKSSDQVKPLDRSVTRVVGELEDIPAVRRWGAIFGPWDCVAEVRFSDEKELTHIVTKEIFGITGVLDTTTILTMSEVIQEGVRWSDSIWE